MWGFPVDFPLNQSIDLSKDSQIDASQNIQHHHAVGHRPAPCLVPPEPGHDYAGTSPLRLRLEGYLKAHIMVAEC